jgi:hypothetical protein
MLDSMAFLHLTEFQSAFQFNIFVLSLKANLIFRNCKESGVLQFLQFNFHSL